MSYCKQYKSPLPDEDSTLCLLTSKCDLVIWGTGLGIVRDTPPYHGEHVCLITWESYDAWLSCVPDKVQPYQLNLILTFDL